MTPKEIIRIGPVEIRFLLDAEDTGGEMAMFEFLVAPGAKVPVAHYHEQFDEAIYGLEGVLSWTLDGQAMEIGPGDRCFVRRGAVHHFINHGAAPTRTLAIITPGLLGPQYFRDMAALVSGGPPDPAKAAEVMRRHGLVPVPPSAKEEDGPRRPS
jgi:quercetin dioxygenase-like cupin family protein